MAGVLDTVNQRTQLVGKNRLELLLFRLNGKQLYGINVFKVKEVLQCPKLNSLPHSNPMVRGVSHIRGGTIPVLDLGLSIGQTCIEDLSTAFVVITEYNMRSQGFLVKSVERIVNTNWEDIHPPPKGAGRKNFLTAVTKIDGELVEIIDVEMVLAQVNPMREEVSEGILDSDIQAQAVNHHVLIVDDSAIARKQIKRCADTVGVESTLLNDGAAALKYLKQMADEGREVSKELDIVISDIEMPEMDGYTFVSEIRADPRLADLYIVLHTSLSGVFNKAMVAKVGADDFLPKFDPDSLASVISKRLQRET